MTRRDYIFLAEAMHEAMRKASNAEQLRGVATAAHTLCSKLAADNARFESQLFLHNCGIMAAGVNGHGVA